MAFSLFRSRLFDLVDEFNDPFFQSDPFFARRPVTMPLLVSMDESCDDDCAPEQRKSTEKGVEKAVQSAEQGGAASTAVAKKPQDNDAWNWLNRGFHAPMDVTETKDSWSLAVDVPGVKPEEVKVEVKNGQLSIRGSRKHNRDETTEENSAASSAAVARFHAVSHCLAMLTKTRSLPPKRMACFVSLCQRTRMPASQR